MCVNVALQTQQNGVPKCKRMKIAIYASWVVDSAVHVMVTGKACLCSGDIEWSMSTICRGEVG